MLKFLTEIGVIIANVIGAIFAVIVFLGFSSLVGWFYWGPTQEDAAWTALQKGQPEAYRIESFLKDYPKTKHADAANRLLDELDWKTASALPSEPDCSDQNSSWSKNDRYRVYLKKRPQGVYATQANEILDAACAKYAEAAHKKGEVPNSYMTYLRLYPQGNSRSSIKSSMISALHDAAIAQRSKKLFEELRDQSGDSSYLRERAEKNISEIDAWELARRADTYESYQLFSTNFRKSLFEKEAFDLMGYHGRWKKLQIQQKIELVADEVSNDFKDEKLLPYPRLETSTEMELIDKCKEDKDFIALHTAATLVFENYDSLRRKFSFGFLADRDQAKNEAAILLKLLNEDEITAVARVAWTRVKLTDEQRNALKTLARVLLEHEQVFDKSYDKVAEDILEVHWTSFNFGTSWYDLRTFPRPSRPCYALPILLPYNSTDPAKGFMTVGADTTTTLYDFWYSRNKDGTKKAISTLLRSVQMLD
jgi:hypothetical protein